MPSRLKSILCGVVLLGLNAWICQRLFGMEYLRHMSSIEGAYVGIARYLSTHWRDMGWFPQWYEGIPFQNTYPPLLHWIVTLAVNLRGITPVHAHHWVTAIAYSLGPVALYLLALQLSGSRWAAFAAGLLYSATSWSAWLIPAIATDLGGIFYPRRLQALVLYGEGPHVASLTVLPVTLLLVNRMLDRPAPLSFVTATVAVAAGVLCNWLGTFSLAVLIVCLLLARVGSGSIRRDLGWLALAGALAYCLAMPWIPPSTIKITEFNAQTLGGDYRTVYKSFPKWGSIIFASLALLKFASRRLKMHLQFSIFFAFLMLLIPLNDAWRQVAIVPQALRYHLEMELALCLLFAFAAHALLKRTPAWMPAVVMALLILVLIQPLRLSRRYARENLIRGIDITTTTEWKTADWLNKNWTGDRVLVPGSTSFWLTAFTDTPELGGGFEQGVIDYMIRIGTYGIYFGTDAARARDGEISVLWLKALGVQAVAVSGPSSGEFYKPFRNPKQFEGLLDPLWRDGDDVLYRVGAPHGSLAHVIRPEDAVVRAPTNGIDVDPLRVYVAAIENPSLPRADFRWTSAHSAKITTDLQPGQIVSVQIAFHKGWHAEIGGARVPIKEDVLGLIAIEPGRAGPVNIEMMYDGGTEMRVARWLCACAGLIMGALLLRATLKKSW
jgi:hypothetical protein